MRGPSERVEEKGFGKKSTLGSADSIIGLCKVVVIMAEMKLVGLLVAFISSQTSIRAGIECFMAPCKRYIMSLILSQSAKKP